MSGRTLLTRSTSRIVDDVALRPDHFVVFSLGDGPKFRFGDQGSSSRMGSAATIRQALTEAQEYRERRALRGADRPRRTSTEALVEVLDGERRALIHPTSDDLLTATLAREFDLDVVLAGMTEDWLVADALAEAGVPVVVGPVMSRSWREELAQLRERPARGRRGDGRVHVRRGLRRRSGGPVGGRGRGHQQARCGADAQGLTINAARILGSTGRPGH